MANLAFDIPQLLPIDDAVDIMQLARANETALHPTWFQFRIPVAAGSNSIAQFELNGQTYFKPKLVRLVPSIHDNNVVAFLRSDDVLIFESRLPQNIDTQPITLPFTFRVLEFELENSLMAAITVDIYFSGWFIEKRLYDNRLRQISDRNEAIIAELARRVEEAG